MLLIDDRTNVKLYGCSNSDGYMIELMKDARNDSGSASPDASETKYYNFGLFDVEKIFRNPTLWFKYIQSGTISAELWFDGISYGEMRPCIQLMETVQELILMGGSLPGSSVTGVEQIEARADIIQELTVLKFARSMGLYLIDSNYNSNWIFMGLHIPYTIFRW